jgi:sulfite reductase beta subunit-like hemoprotein
VELREFQADAALARQKWLVNAASPTELRAEARYESQTQFAANQQAHADASLQAQKERDQYAGYKPMPAQIDRATLIKASKEQLRQWSRLFGQFQLNAALRGQ